MLQNLNVNRESKKLNGNVYNALRRSVLEALDYEWNFCKPKLPLFHVFREFIFSKYVKATWLIFDWNKYTSNNIYFYYLLNSNLIF